MLLSGGEEEVLKSRIHFIHFLILGGVPYRVPQPHKLLLDTQISDWQPLSKMCSSLPTVTDDGWELLESYHFFSWKC